ncbi:hypothetical protein RASY3_03085 [Ruminococcus albus SY3]|uniref:Uncharacterized protein n=1 Tax=Ruminococcus albus SY3 TaxID=1341156 RepID=A0A011UKA3_RUMAL|nr:hypothetical protein [Ruminococcus albus]EXM38685.1 hypothetical protein RASY3_18350 [Ruminococcus albus SY3]EXM41039.1 hypothetical protein RASY3_03085 [Ruminococcus albus SY3]
MKNTKRFITGMVTLAMVSAMAPMNVFATENTIPLNANTSSGSTDVKYSVDPSYTVVIPASITLSDTAATSASISVDETAKPFKLAKGQKLSLKIANEGTNDFKVTNADDSLDYTVTAGSETLAKGSTAAEFSNDDKTDKTLTFSKMDASKAKYAGDYTGTLTFGISVESAETIVDLSTLTADYVAKDGVTLTGTLAANVKISIADGATVTLKDANITNLGENCDWAGINCPNDATIILKGTNTICAGRGSDDYNNYPGIWIASGKTLTIGGDGSLTAYSNAINPGGAGIGGGYQVACGNIVINGGTITATGGNCAAGIGSGADSSCGNITINGGTITATGGNYAAGIGSGNRVSSNTSCGNITIANTVTKVTATGGFQTNSIGAGQNSACGTVTIGGVEGAISASPYTYEP